MASLRFGASEGADQGRRRPLPQRIKPGRAPVQPEQQTGKVPDEIDDLHAIVKPLNRAWLNRFNDLTVRDSTFFW